MEVVANWFIWTVAILTIWLWGPLALLYLFWVEILGGLVGLMVGTAVLYPRIDSKPSKTEPSGPAPGQDARRAQEAATWREERKAAIRQRYADLAEVEVKRFEKEWVGAMKATEVKRP